MQHMLFLVWGGGLKKRIFYVAFNHLRYTYLETYVSISNNIASANGKIPLMVFTELN
jgi:hypothetical protein